MDAHAGHARRVSEVRQVIASALRAQPFEGRPSARLAPTAPGTGLALLNALVVCLILLVPIGLSPITGFLSNVLCAGLAFVTAMLYFVSCIKLGDQRDLSGFLLVPLLISALQNIYLGLVAPYAASVFIQLALITHVTYCFLLLLTYFLSRPAGATHPMLVVLTAISVCIVLFSAVSVVAFQSSLVAMASSARNLLAPFIFLMLGLLLAERVRVHTFLQLIALLAWITILFGFFEYLGSNSVWHALNIEMLWFRKGIPNMAEWGLPANFVSSEKFFGMQVRRMVSSYADPVNFGTVLFLFTMVSWYLRRWGLLLLCLVAVALTISKGALLGLLVFGLVFAWRSGNRLVFTAAMAVVGVLGAAVVAYSLVHSTQSLMTHVRGLLAAFATLPDHPLGRGLGGAGVLADSGDLRESGLGLIIGQMGLLAFVLFGAFFYGMWSRVARLTDPRKAVLAQSLFLGLLGNIAFNEVAMSPNSSGGYFLLLGLLIAGDWHQRREQVSAVPAPLAASA